MYPFFHASVGLAVHTATYAVTKSPFLTFAIGTPLAIFSHWVADFLFEAGLSAREALISEGLGILIFWGCIPIFLEINALYVSIFAASWIAGNLFDFIDKKLYLTSFFPKRFKVTYIFHKHKNGIRFSVLQTKLAAVVGGVITIICSLIISNV